jgi:hypothetical protein
MAKRKESNKKKYVKALFSIPDETYKTFISVVPQGKKSQLIANFMQQYVQKYSPSKKPKEENMWELCRKACKGDYSHEDPVELAHNAWNYVD